MEVVFSVVEIIVHITTSSGARGDDVAGNSAFTPVRTGRTRSVQGEVQALTAMPRSVKENRQESRAVAGKPRAMMQRAFAHTQ